MKLEILRNKKSVGSPTLLIFKILLNFVSPSKSIF